jgi:hypothetical protein
VWCVMCVGASIRTVATFQGWPFSNTYWYYSTCLSFLNIMKYFVYR